MADAFISYSRADREIAQKLSIALTSAGFGVWWDSNITAAETFRDVIQSELRRAKAIIVIWTINSAASSFVRQEAQEGIHFKKLISTRTRSTEIIDVPLGFREQHIEFVENTDRVFTALRCLIGSAEAAAAKGAEPKSLVSAVQSDNSEELAQILRFATKEMHMLPSSATDFVLKWQS